MIYLLVSALTNCCCALSCREWNTNTRNAHLAQVLLRAILSKHTPQQILEVPGKAFYFGGGIQVDTFAAGQYPPLGAVLCCTCQHQQSSACLAHLGVVTAAKSAASLSLLTWAVRQYLTAYTVGSRSHECLRRACHRRSQSG